MKKIAFLLLYTVLSQISHAQSYGSLWKFSMPPAGKPVLSPKEYRNVSAQEQQLQEFLSGVTVNASSPLIIMLPSPEGSMRPFYVWETPVMERPLADKYNSIHTYTATAVDNHLVTAKIDYTQFGFHAMVVDGKNTFFIDPFGTAANGNYITYYRRNYSGTANSGGICAVGETDKGSTGAHPTYAGSTSIPQLQFRMNGTTRRTYRLALACTGEYSVSVAGPSPSKAAVLSKMVTTLNRVNSVYERDLAITMQLVANDDTLIFLDGANDPYSDNLAVPMLTQNQSTVDARIGTSNYDIGHVFGTGGGGGAGTGLGIAVHGICNAGLKAQGVTGTPTPTGDAFDIDYVAHEMGHQYGAEHTFNSWTSGSCTSFSAVAASAYEPGSGSTIMAYAGICGNENIQRNTDAYFHSSSLEEITAYVSVNTCGVIASSGNTNAILPAFSAEYSIPYFTAFELTAPVATDATADTVSYCWEQRDLGDFGRTINQTRLKGPLFRSFLPTASRTRIFPSIDSLLKSVFVSKQEKVPDTSRTLCFRLTERDIFQGFGCFNFPDDSIKLNVIYTGSPFRVTSPSASVNWAGGTAQTVTWNVGKTDIAPINCANVDIYLSTDGGYTFPTLLAGNTPNDGSEPVTLPNGNMADLRIKVKAVGNVFFAISHTAPPTVVEKRPIPTPGVNISPVPADKAVEIHFINAGESAFAKIENAIGQVIWSGKIVDQQIVDVSTWAKGVYYIRLNNGSTINVTRPILVN